MSCNEKNYEKIFIVGTVDDILNQKGTTFMSGDSKKPYNQWKYKLVDFEIPLNTKYKDFLTCILQEINEFKVDCNKMLVSQRPKKGDKVIFRIKYCYPALTKEDVKKARIIEVINN
jgi:hypothetical protein